MKKSDIAMIILIASVSVMAAYFTASALIGDVREESVQVRTAKPISSEVVSPDPEVFNEGSINPAVEVIVGNSEN